MVDKLKVNITEINLSELEKLKSQWAELELIANNSIFTSWHWISTWLAFTHYSAKLITVTLKHETIGLAFITENKQSKFGFNANQLWINRTGNTAQDQIWNEYNDILCCEGLEYAIRAAVLEHFDRKLSQVDELIIGVSDINIAQTPLPNNMMQYTSWKTTSYSTDLKTEFSNWHQYLQSISKNTRSQIKRSAKLYGGIDNFTVTRASSTAEALQYLHAVGQYHKLRWSDQKSGFKNPLFIRFHESLITHKFESGCVDILKVQINNKVICYLYNLIYKDTVYFYLSGIEYSNDNRLKPGLLSHSLAIAHYAKRGYKKYDFMGGEGRYKKSLSNHRSSMIISNFRRRSLPFILSGAIRKAKAVYTKAIQ